MSFFNLLLLFPFRLLSLFLPHLSEKQMSSSHRHVVRDVVVENQPEQPVEQRQVDLVGHLGQLRLQHHHRLALGRVPHALQVVDALAPLVHQQRGGLRVRGLDPVGEERALVGLVPEVLVEVAVGDLLEGLDLVDRDDVAVVFLGERRGGEGQREKK